MFVGNYEERNTLLKKFGFNSVQHYRQSPLWKIIREEVRRRDHYQCSVPNCLNKGEHIHHVGWNSATLLGSTKLLVSLCRKHHREVEFENGEKLFDLSLIFRRTAELCSNTKCKPGVSNPQFGNWFKRQTIESYLTNKKVAKRLKFEWEDWFLRFEDYYQKILSD